MPYEYIEYEERDGGAIVRFDRPEKLNAINRSMRVELVDALERAEANSNVRAVAIRGNGRAFSAGYDFDEGPNNPDAYDTIDDYMLDFHHDYLTAILDLDIPTIAAVNGFALAGACNLTLYCDITYASERAEFGYPEMHMAALPGAMVDPFVGLSIKHAKELYFSGRRIDAHEAARIGMANRVVPHDELMDEVWNLIDDIKLTPPAVVTLAKARLNKILEEQGFPMLGKIDHYLWAATMMLPTRQEFAQIAANEGINTAIEWMHDTEKW